MVRKELTDKMKEGIVEAQINFLKKNHPYFLVGNGGNLKIYLAQGLNEYSPEKVNVDKKVDIQLLQGLQNGNKNTAGRVITAARLINFDAFNLDDIIKDRHLLILYKNNEYARRNIRNYGGKTSKLLSDYLIKKGLIED